jgi:hypothetical protein
MSEKVCELIIPDAGPLITLAYASRLDLLLAIQAKVVVIDMVKIDLTRHLTPTSQLIIDFIADNAIEVVETKIGKEATRQGADFKKRHAGERAIQDSCSTFMMQTMKLSSKRSLRCSCSKTTRCLELASSCPKTHTLSPHGYFLPGLSF